MNFKLIKISIELKIDLKIEDWYTLQGLMSHYTFVGLQIQKNCSDLSLNMSESKQSSTLHELEMSELPQGSPEEIAKDAPAPMKAAQSPWICNIKRCMFLIFLVISSTVLVAEINAADSEPPIIDTGDFTFLVYCPYSYKAKARPVLLDDNESGQLRRRRLYSAYSYSVELLHPETLPEYDWSNTYVVDMQSRKNSSGAVNFYYCGLVTNFGSTCDEDVFQACSSPGPMFDLKTSQHADIIWVNNLNEQYFRDDRCMSIESKEQRCKLMFKSKSNRTQTFIDPTIVQGHHQQMQINSSQWPATAHVHGAEVRPTFDGNPLSWIANDGSRGVGAFSLSDKCYYDAFDQYDTAKNFYMPPEVVVKRLEDDEDILVLPQAKVNRYPNIQNPGNLWYHDHAMRLTLYNVQYGLSGLYILRDPIVQAQIGVSIKNQKLVMMTTTGWKTTQNLQAASDVVYRFRFLNNFFGGSPYRVFFAYGGCTNPTSIIPFTIIGGDSSLFNEGLYNQNNFIIGQAERMEILIMFDPSQKNYSICAPTSTDPFPPVPKSTGRTESASLSGERNNNIEEIRLISGIENKFANLNKRKQINNVALSVPYTDFNDPNLPIAVKRMRPLMIFPGPIFSINGRTDFHAGNSENPKIGTYEDWYLINTMGGAHPIHVHLINFQVVKVLSLRKTSNVNGCFLYELDFIVEAIKTGSSFLNNPKYFPDPSDLRNVSYTAICADKSSVFYASADLMERLNQVNVEDVVDLDGVSGIDVEKPLTSYERDLFASLNITVAPGENGKYVTNEANEIKPYYRRWKDTALVEGGKVFVYRIRWAKSSYAGANDTPFHVPVDQLREYPGFVYHCHILNHEDNEMMRPIMLQLPANAKLNPETPCNSNPSDYSWATKVNCINERCLAP